MKTIEQQLNLMVKEWRSLFIELKKQIGDDYRANEEDDCPGMCVTIGFTPESEDKDASWSGISFCAGGWGYQTGDNSFSGGAYGHPHWAVISLYRTSNSTELANDCADQIAELVSA